MAITLHYFTDIGKAVFPYNCVGLWLNFAGCTSV